ncbi:MAG: hypothetical protein U9P14_09045 [Gemmatimonadota bacterium]|nr:hypothetical protein [Gemmatimonadota bacterium]
MFRPSRIIFTALAAASLLVLFAAACNKKTTVEVQETYLLYRDILGNAEFEADGNYPPPANLDNFYDGEIVVTLYFGEQLDIFQKDDIYGYMITADEDPVNYHFKFVPDGKYWLEAEFTVLDSCFSFKSGTFDHAADVDTEMELRPVFLGLNMNCFNVTLSGVSEGECVPVGEEKKFWVTRKVYDRFYRDMNEQ